MANGHGGYRRPEKPAPVSGPGKFSRRTDGGPADEKHQAPRWTGGAEYGEGTELMEIQGAAPMAGGPAAPSLDFGAPTARPDEPITHGAPFGAGAGPEALAFGGPQVDHVAAGIRAAYALNPSPALKNLVDQLDAEGR